MRIIVEGQIQNNQSAQLKIEVSPVSRGTLHEAEQLDIVEQVEDEFGFASIQTVSIPDLYGGKLCAAMDRQHPRDFYDVKVLLESRGVDRDIFIGFLTYMLSHNRPLSEIVNPRWKDISGVFKNEFIGMTFDPISLDELQTIHTLMVIAADIAKAVSPNRLFCAATLCNTTTLLEFVLKYATRSVRLIF